MIFSSSFPGGAANSQRSDIHKHNRGCCDWEHAGDCVSDETQETANPH